MGGGGEEVGGEIEVLGVSGELVSSLRKLPSITVTLLFFVLRSVTIPIAPTDGLLLLRSRDII